jgi:hypothetical protein
LGMETLGSRERAKRRAGRNGQSTAIEFLQANAGPETLDVRDGKRVRPRDAQHQQYPSNCYDDIGHSTWKH